MSTHTAEHNQVCTLITDAVQMSATAQEISQAGLTHALVPTMGNLHAGHLELIKRAKTLADRVTVTLFVNPAQFGEGEDFESYPRTQERDLDALHALDVDTIFIPKTEQLYPDGPRKTTKVDIPFLSQLHCGKTRPDFFPGVCTVVTKLLHIVRPNIALFGEKDWQQLMMIKKMVRELFLPVTILSCPTVREASGLACSSRNLYLSDVQRNTIAPKLQQVLAQMKMQLETGEKRRSHLEGQAKEQLQKLGFDVDYINIVEAQTLRAPSETDKSLVILAATCLDSTRLIDNIQVTLT